LLLGCITGVTGLPAPQLARAGDINVGTINLLDYVPSEPGDRAGVSVVASQKADLTKTCLAGATLHWIQLATASTAMGPVLPPGFIGPPQPNLGMAGFPNERTFIDPIPGQPLGSGTTPQFGNNTPFYDITANSRVALLDPMQWMREGTGTYFGDQPNVFAKDVPNKSRPAFELTFQTLLVATTADATHTLRVLGGFSWGFTVNKVDGKLLRPNLEKATALSWSQINPEVWQTALDQYFRPPVGPPSYTLMQAKCKEGNLVVSFANPEPSSSVLAGIAVVALCATRVLRRRAGRRSAPRS
jgi:hypothetical protein